MQLVRALEDVDAFVCVPGPALRVGEAHGGRFGVVEGDEAYLGTHLGARPGGVLDGAVGALKVRVTQDWG